MARMHWDEPSVPYQLPAEPNSFAVLASLWAMIPSASYSSSAPAISVMSSPSQPRGPRPLWPGMWSRAVSEAA